MKISNSNWLYKLAFYYDYKPSKFSVCDLGWGVVKNTLKLFFYGFEFVAGGFLEVFLKACVLGFKVTFALVITSLFLVVSCVAIGPIVNVFDIYIFHQNLGLSEPWGLIFDEGFLLWVVLLLTYMLTLISRFFEWLSKPRAYKPPKPKQPSLFWTWVKAKMDRVCVIIEVED